MLSSLIISLLAMWCCKLANGSPASFANKSSSSAFIIPPCIIKSKANTALAALENGEEATQIDSQPSFTLKKRNPYDVHVYYNGSNQREKAMLLRSKMKQQFPWMRFYEPKDRPIGPHPLPMWEADFASYDNRVLWGEVCDFIKEEHEELSVLVHPHSLDGDYADHTKNAFWVGDVLELRIQGWKR
mmetsp:Transcript_284/g.551  ORF Transcript_284/g.551 Transcript_284/m.551 type:complete len:186 (-) Transcript_284:1507-2064(-)